MARVIGSTNKNINYEVTIKKPLDARSLVKTYEDLLLESNWMKDGKPIVYKSGWQVATEGLETTDPIEAMKMIKAYGGNCGIWFSNGIYYIDKSHRVSTKKEALQIGRECNQISILISSKWRKSRHTGSRKRKEYFMAFTDKSWFFDTTPKLNKMCFFEG